MQYSSCVGIFVALRAIKLGSFKKGGHILHFSTILCSEFDASQALQHISVFTSLKDIDQFPLDALKVFLVLVTLFFMSFFPSERIVG